MTGKSRSLDPRTRLMVAELARALGGIERLADLESVLCSGSLKLIATSPVHICGYWECAWTTAGQFRSTVWLPGDIRVRTVFDASTGEGWVLEADDSVQPLPPEERQELRGWLYLLSLSWLEPKRIRGIVQAELEAGIEELAMHSVDGSPCTVACAANALPEELRWMSPVAKRGLHPRLLAARIGLQETPPVAGPRTTGLTRWADVEGYQVPRQIEEKTTGGPTYIYYPEKFEFNPSLPADYFARPMPPPPDTQFPNGTHSVTLPFTLLESRIVLPVRVNGEGPFPFLLDTGTSASMLDIELAKRLKLPLRCSFKGNLGGGSGVTTVDLAEGVTLQLEGLESRTHNIMVMSINSRTETYAGFETLGFLGGDFVGRFVLDIDYEQLTVTFHDATRPPPTLPESLPIQVSSGVPMMGATLALTEQRLEVTLMMDTGAGWAGVLNQPFVQSQGLQTRISPTIETVTFGVSGEAPLALGRTAALELGDQPIDQPLLALALEAAGTLGSTAFSGILGAEALRRFWLRLDYRRATVTFTPNAYMQVPIEYDMSGMVLQSDLDRGTFQVAFVVAGSPAAQAKVRKLDQIVAINGRPTAKWSLPEFLSECRRPGRKLRLDVKRGEEEFVVEIQTRRLI